MQLANLFCINVHDCSEDVVLGNNDCLTIRDVQMMLSKSQADWKTNMIYQKQNHADVDLVCTCLKKMSFMPGSPPVTILE